MDYDSSSKFISSLAKFLQSLCNGYVEFDNGVEVIGHIYLSVDTGKKIDYILNEKVCKTDENSVTFISNSFHAQPAEKPKPTSKKSKSDSDPKQQDDLVEIDLDSDSQIEPKSTNYGTLPRNSSHNQPSPSHRQGKRPSSPLKAGRHSPSSKRGRIESQDPSHISNNGLSVPSPAVDPTRGSNIQGAEGPSLGTDYSDSYHQDFSQGEEGAPAEESEERDIKPNIDADITFVKEEFAPSSQTGEGSDDRNQADDASVYSQMYHQPYSGGQGYSSQSYGMPGSSRLSYGAGERSEMFDPGQGSSQMEGDGTDPSGPNYPYSRNGGIQRNRYGGLLSGGVNCDYCGKMCQSKRDLVGHVNAKHLKVKPYVCPRCQRTFSYYRNLHVHQKKCNGGYSQNTLKDEPF